MATTPRRALSAAEKRERDEAYRVDPKQFTDILKGLVKIFNGLAVLNSALGQAGKGAYLVWDHPTQPGQFLQLNRRQIKSANSKFAAALLDLKNYLRVSRKKTREQIKPDSFSGTYTPVYAGEALTTFFTRTPGNFGPLNPIEAQRTQQAGDSLMDQLVMAKQGYLLRNTITMLFYIYAHAQNIQDPANAQFARSDDVMTEAFGGIIPAAFYSQTAGKKTLKIPMAEAIQRGFIPAAMNTYQVVQANHPDFNPARFNTYFFQNIAAANYYSRAALAADPVFAEAAAALQLPDPIPNPLPALHQAMLNEHNLVKDVSTQWHDILEPDRKVARDARKRELDAQKRAAGGAARARRGRGAAR